MPSSSVSHSLSVRRGSSHVQIQLADGLTTLFRDGRIAMGNDGPDFQEPGVIQFRRSDNQGNSVVEIWNGLPCVNHNDERFGRLTTPFSLQCDDVWIEMCEQQPLEELRVTSSRRPQRIGRRGDEAITVDDPPSLQTLQLWFEALGAVQRHPANSKELFHAVSKALVNPGGLDAAMVIVLDETGQWVIKASVIEKEPLGLTFQESIANHVQQSNAAHVISGFPAAMHRSVIAVPFFNAAREFAGLIYGTRDTTGKNERESIRTIELQYAQALAEGVTSGFKRFQIEQKEAHARYVFGRSFSPPLVKALTEKPDLLTPRLCEISVLLADLRGFTELSEQLGAELSCELLTDVMNALTEEVMETDGVVLDYYGDGLAAMWNAPQEQDDFVQRACDTGARMQHRICEVSERWLSFTKQPIRLAIGVATGDAMVGNAGSDMRMKYGPRGTTINLASRLESAAKKLDIGVLICGETRKHLPADSCERRVGFVRLPGIETPHEVFELQSVGYEPSREDDHFDAYLQALRLFEAEQYAEASEILERLDARGNFGGAARALHKQAKYLEQFGQFADMSTIQFLPQRDEPTPSEPNT